MISRLSISVRDAGARSIRQCKPMAAWRPFMGAIRIGIGANAVSKQWLGLAGWSNYIDQQALALTVL